MILNWLAAGLTGLFLTWMINLYNFMDGMDGFAGGMAAFGFGTLAAVGLIQGNLAYGLFNLIIAAALGFLVFNFPPARIFMGDVGSSVLGLLAGGSLIWAHQHGLLSIWIGLIVFSPFVVDATVTLLRRILAGEPFWQPHKTHYYQRLVQHGWGHKKTLYWEYALMSLCSAVVLGSLYLPIANDSLLTLMVLVFYGALLMLTHQYAPQSG